MKTTKKSITIEQALKASDSSKNQEIKRKFVEREVYCNVGTLCEYVLSKGFEDSNAPFTMDDIENYYSPNVDTIIDNANDLWDYKEEEFKAYANDPDTFNRRMKKIGDLAVFIHSLDSNELQEFCQEFDIEYETEASEIFEWWAVSEYLYNKLKDMDYCVVDAGSCYVWGRTTTGQAILLDYAISKICADMEILEGQSNAWTV
jgi:hypothetical protein